MEQKQIRFIELFAGIGGFRFGLESVDRRVGYVESINRTQNGRGKENTQRVSEVGQGLESTQRERVSTEKGWAHEHPHHQPDNGTFTCIYSNEINEHANAIYRRNYGQEEAHQDTRSIGEVGAREIPDHDLLVAGFPCQSFSIAGQRGGFGDTRGTLFFDVARILSEKRPKHFILENVKGLLSHEQGHTFNTIIGVLTNLGYRCEWEVVNSKYFGVPQSRDRVFVVGHLRGECVGRVLPLRRASSFNTKQVEQGRVVKAIHNIYGGFKEKFVRVFDILPTLRTPKGGGHIPTILIKDGIHYILRWITPKETERGQAFPDDWTKYGDYGGGVLDKMSNTQRYRAMGNAVTTSVIKSIGEKLLEECY